MNGEHEGKSIGTGRWLRLLPLAMVALASLAVFATGLHRALSLEAIVASRDDLQAFVADRGAWAVLAYAATYVTVVALSVPGAVFLTIAGGFLFGWALGGMIALLSATVGAILIFLIARTSLGDLLIARAGPRLQALAAGFHKDAFSYLLVLRLLPVVPFWLTNLAAAFLGVRADIFAFATAIGLVPGTFAFAAAGAGLDSILTARKAASEACRAAGRLDCTISLTLSDLLAPQLVLALVALAALAVLPILLRRWRADPLDREREAP